MDFSQALTSSLVEEELMINSFVIYGSWSSQVPMFRPHELCR